MIAHAAFNMRYFHFKEGSVGYLNCTNKKREWVKITFRPMNLTFLMVNDYKAS